ncbi:hypothetical protein [Prevotella corporis]|uniref:Uncharacterized protein n=1 Tax=Prevotella corporis TaxID=28128 RepID=A0A133QJG5_9BACT|nr:hypothetical protein [Prevotella corporis]KXA43025.1 hypothetical protein HMPREF3226_00560 [Prevotella corporis]
MKRWQKIIGALVLMALALYDYFVLTWARIGVATIKGYRLTVSNMRQYALERIDELGIIILVNFLVALLLFICLWRKK